MPNLHLHLHPCTCKSFSSSIPLICFVVPHKSIQTRITSISCSKTPNSYSTVSIAGISKIPKKVSVLRRTHVSFCSPNDDFEEISSEKPENEREELELRGKPSPLPVNGNAPTAQIEPTRLDKDEVLEPFLKFFKAKDDIINVKQQVQVQEEEEEEEVEEEEEEEEGGAEEVVAKKNKVDVEFYEPKPGDFVVGVVVSGNENKLDLNIGADLLGTMLTKEVLPLYDKDLPYLLCDIEKDCKEFMVRGKIGIFFDEDAVGGKPMPGRPIVEIGTVLFAEVLGRTLSGRPLLSTRRFFRRVAWHRVRQIKQLNEPIEVRITEWNTGGLLTRIEGLRGFIPKMELINRVNTFTDLKENVGRKIFVQITRIDETNNDLILSEREAWEMTYLREGTLLEGTVRKIFPYGAQVRIGDTNRSGLLHISNVTRARIDSVSELLTVNEKVKALVVKSMFPDKISLSIAELESEPGLFVSNKEKVFSEAEEMAKKYRQKSSATFSKHKLHSQPTDVTPFHDEEKLYSNWKWFKFERCGE